MLGWLSHVYLLSLTQPQINNKITSTCQMFATFTQSLSRYLITGDPDLVASANAASSSNPTPSASRSAGPYVYDPHRVDKMFDMLAKYEENFARHLKILLDTLNYLAATETVVFLSLCARLQSAGEGGMVAMVVGEGFGV
jgi:gamma-tubulin complex component 2